jgi:hypothetical protein
MFLTNHGAASLGDKDPVISLDCWMLLPMLLHHYVDSSITRIMDVVMWILQEGGKD